MEDIYCQQIIPGKLKVDMVFETDQVMAFHHTKPYWEHHVVIIPKTHIDSLSTYPNTPALNKDIFEAIKVVTKLFEEHYGGCKHHWYKLERVAYEKQEAALK